MERKQLSHKHFITDHGWVDAIPVMACINIRTHHADQPRNINYWVASHFQVQARHPINMKSDL